MARPLLRAAALSVGLTACMGSNNGEQPLPGNPKGAGQDTGAVKGKKKAIPLPGNPKGSIQDGGAAKTKKKTKKKAGKTP